MNQSANAVLAKVRCMYGKRLTAADYQALLACNSNQDIANYLKTRTSYGDIFAPNSGTKITAEAIEFSLNKEYANRLQTICSFEKMIDNPFFKYYVLKSDIQVIISAARNLVSTSAFASTYIPNDFFKAASALNIQKVYASTTAQELIDSLKHTPYHGAARRFIGTDGVFDFSQVEIILGAFYAQSAKEMGKYLPKKAAKELNEMIDLEIDALNINTIFRRKKMDVSPDIILAGLIMHHGTLSASKLTRLVECESTADFVSIVGTTKLGKNFTNDDLIFPEKVYEKNTYAINKHFLRFSANANIAVLTYFNLLETEIKNIIHITEGKRYRLPEEEIQKYLIGVNA
ncbi:MAG: V-type ATPase subunit [Clostridia bacterium]|nr:V-type ATPase subunit [Clostridia bacterium]